MVIENINVLNFKSFKELNFDLKKINIILGPNNSGKSNILKLFLLLKQTINASPLSSALLLNGAIKFGSYKNITYNFNEREILLRFIIGVTEKIKKRFYGEEFYIEGEDIGKKLRYLCEFKYFFDVLKKRIIIKTATIKNIENNQYLLEYDENTLLKLKGLSPNEYLKMILKNLNKIVEILQELNNFRAIFEKLSKSKTTKIRGSFYFKRNSDKAKEKIIFYDYFSEIFQKEIDVEEFITLNNKDFFPRLEIEIDEIQGKLKKFEILLGDIYRLIYFFGPRKQIDENILIKIKGNFDNLRKLTVKVLNVLETLDDIGWDLFSIQNSFEYFFMNLHYIGPLREYPQRYYPSIGETVSDVGFRGEYIAQLLNMISEKEFYKDFNEKILYWLNQFEMAKSTFIKTYSDISEFISILFEEYYTGNKVNISDMGFGTSQVIPIIMEGFLISPDSVLIVEQPEIHLHPKAQSVLGDLFIQISKEGKTLIIETHSEHLFRRIQRRIAEGEISNSEVAFYYVTMGVEGSNLQVLEIEENGYIKNIPEGFFDEDYNEAYEHLMRVIENEEEKKS